MRTMTDDEVDAIVEASKTFRIGNRDNKSHVSPNDMRRLLACGAEVKINGKQVGGGFILEVELHGERFITVSDRNLSYLLKP